MRLRGKGVENVNIKKKGNMYVITKVIIPEKLTRTQKDLIEKLSKTELDNSKYFKTYKRQAIPQSLTDFCTTISFSILIISQQK